jgi:WD40 repeat protein
MWTFVHADIRAPRSGGVTQVEFRDAGTVVSASKDGTTRFWDVATGAQKEEMPGEQFTFSKGPSDPSEQMAGKYVVTVEGDLLLVHLSDTAISSASGKAEQNKKPMAFFRASAPIQTLQCAGDKIAVGCANGEVLHLRAAFLVT